MLDLNPSSSAHAGLGEIAIPIYFTPEPANGALGVGLSQQAQASFHSGFLCAGATAAHGLGHQALVDVNVGPHRNLYV